jgi:hypothetical protein
MSDSTSKPSLRAFNSAMKRLERELEGYRHAASRIHPEVERTLRKAVNSVHEVQIDASTLYNQGSN